MILLIQLCVMIYTLAGVASKYASAEPLLSFRFVLFYGLEICILGLYAIVWQQIIKKVDLSIAYANRAVALLWSVLWAALLFGENISLKNIIGVIVVIIGTIIVNDHND